jgi:hypothetical protein
MRRGTQVGKGGLNIGGIPQGNSNGGLGSIYLTGLSTLGSNGYLPSFEYSDTSQITDNVTKTVGRQTMKAGFQWQRLGFSILQPPNGRGSWEYQGLYTEVPTTTGGNTCLEDVKKSISLKFRLNRNVCRRPSGRL